MQQFTEYEGKTIDDAIKSACEALAVPREKLNIEIISEGSSGFLGLGAKKAKIKAGLLLMDAVFAGNYDSDNAGEPRAEEDNLSLKEEDDLPFTEDNLSLKEEDDEGEEVFESLKAEAGFAENYVIGETSEMGNEAREFLEGILTRMSIPCIVTVEETAERIFLNIQGDGGGLLIGKKGKNLDALQYIVNKAINLSGKVKKIVTIDTEAYRKRRETSLISLAQRLAEKAKRTQRPITLNHMNAHNRRIIHLTLKDDASVTTKSRGEGEFRKIVIIPAKKDA